MKFIFGFIIVFLLQNRGQN